MGARPGGVGSGVTSRTKEHPMNGLAKACVGAAGLAFVFAVVTAFTGSLFSGLGPEGYSRACTNLALLALCLFLGFKEDTAGA